MKKSVGLVIITWSPTEGFKVALQRRGVQNSFPGACQVTVHGKLEKNEGFNEALIRECCEELGHEFTQQCQRTAELVELSHEKSDEKEIMTFGVLISEDKLNLIHLKRTSGGIDHVNGEIFFNGEIIEITPDKKKEGYPPTVRAMFTDEIMAVKNALHLLNIRTP